MNSLESVLSSQYEKSLRMLLECLQAFTRDLWLDSAYQNPAWHIAYHVLYYTNIYLSSSEEGILHWKQERHDLHRLASAEHPENSVVLKQAVPFLREDLISFLQFITENLDYYLQNMSIDEPAWPSWYDQTQGEFHLNNLRHLQHHTGELMERLNNRRGYSCEWY